jgi:hypothetical protein
MLIPHFSANVLNAATKVIITFIDGFYEQKEMGIFSEGYAGLLLAIRA